MCRNRLFLFRTSDLFSNLSGPPTSNCFRMQGNSVFGSCSSWNSASIAYASRFLEATNATPFVGFCIPVDESWIAGCKATSLANSRSEKSRRGNASVVLSMRPKPASRGNVEPLAPHQPESRQGRFLTDLLHMYPRHVPAAAEEQLHKLAEERAVASAQKEFSVAGLESVLYKRIAELKAEDRSKAVQDIMYALVVQKFVVARVPLVVKAPRLETDKVWPDKDKKLLSIHSHEVLGIVQKHLTMMLGASSDVDPHGHVQISQTLVGRAYAASIKCGYFLKRVDPRYQLEKRFQFLPRLIDTQQAGRGARNSFGGSELSLSGFIQPKKSSELMAYVRSFDNETVCRFAITRSRESFNIIGKQTEALFGRPSLQIDPDGSVTLCNDEIVWVSFSKLRRLILEAVAFGSFLCDVEMHIDSHYELGGS